jgi:hypothetical protein
MADASPRTIVHGCLRSLHLVLTMSAFPLAMACIGDVHTRHDSIDQLAKVLSVVLGGGMLSLGLVMADQVAYPPGLLASLAFTGPMVLNATTGGSVLEGGYALAYAALGSQTIALVYALVTRWNFPTMDWFSRIYLTLTVLSEIFCLYWFRRPFLARLDSQTLALGLFLVPFAMQVVCGGVILSRRLFGKWSLESWARPSMYAAGLSMMAGWLAFGFSQN